MYTPISLAGAPQTAVVARCAPRVAGAPHGRGLRPEKVTYFVGTDEQAAVVHSRRQRGRASSSTEKPIHGGPHSVIRELPTAKFAAQTAANDAMPRAAGGRKSCSSSALPTGKCECRLASSDEAPAEGVKVGEVRCASSRRVLIVRVVTRPAFCDRASTWAAGAVMRSPMVDDSPV